MNEISNELLRLIGLKITKVEVISLCHILRLYLENGLLIDLPGSWRYRSDKATLFGALDIDFYIEMDDDYLDEVDRVYEKKASSLIGKKITQIDRQGTDILFVLNGKRYIDLFDLSSDGLSILIKNY